LDDDDECCFCHLESPITTHLWITPHGLFVFFFFFFFYLLPTFLVYIYSVPNMQ
jgi:hypothetical protein